MYKAQPVKQIFRSPAEAKNFDFLFFLNGDDHNELPQMGGDDKREATVV